MLQPLDSCCYFLQVLTSTSTVVFQTLACDEEAVEGESYLRADYSLSCNTAEHTWYKMYAAVMIVVRGWLRPRSGATLKFVAPPG